MPYRSDLTYVYDGSFDGFMCCVFEHYDKRIMPMAIQPVGSAANSIFDTMLVETDVAKAERVYSAIRQKISPQAQELVDLGFLTCLPEKEMHLLRFLRIGFSVGGSVMTLLTDPTVHQLQKSVRHLTTEAHKLKGFVRFSICADVLVAVIEPKNHVLPLLQPHFCDRYSGEAFMIYDKVHKSALVYRRGESVITDLDDYEMPACDPVELEYRQLWRQFYDTIAIEGRYNPRCRMSHMPKRYWKHLPELNEGEGSAARPIGSGGRGLIDST